MNAPHPVATSMFAIDPALIHNLIASCVALEAKPNRTSYRYVDVLRAAAALFDTEALDNEIADWDDDDSEVECLACGRNCRGACDARHDDLVARDFGSDVVL